MHRHTVRVEQPDTLVLDTRVPIVQKMIARAKADPDYAAALNESRSTPRAMAHLLAQVEERRVATAERRSSRTRFARDLHALTMHVVAPREPAPPAPSTTTRASAPACSDNPTLAPACS